MRLSSLVRRGSSHETLPSESTPVETMTARSPDRRRILVIDCNDDYRALLCDQLVAMGFDVTGENNGVAGLARIASGDDHLPFQGMLVELDMPLLGGMAVLQEMRDRHPTIPVIAMSDAQRVEQLRKAVRLGACEYLVKPFDMMLLRRKCVQVFLDGDPSSS